MPTPERGKDIRRVRLFGRGEFFTGAALVGVVLVGLILFGIHRSRVICRDKLIRSGFPESYAERLVGLQLEHRGWQFLPLRIDDLSWERIVDRECAPGWNLVNFSAWAPDAWGRFGTANYTPYYAENAKAYDSGAWYQASRAAVAYFMDPRNFLDEDGIFMFESLGYNESAQGRAAVEQALSGTFMADAPVDGGPRKFSELILATGRKLGISPVFIAARLASEQGKGSPQAFGTIGDLLVDLYTNGTERIGKAVVWGKTFAKDGTKTAAVVARGREFYNGHYNLFNIGAYGSGVFEIKYNAWKEAVSEETCAKYCGPWTSQERALRGGAARIKEKYVDTHRYTRYFQKFSVVPAAGAFRWKQYMQNIAAPLVESRNTCKAYEAAGTLDAPYRFVIPVYVGMPERPCPDPANGKSVYSTAK